MLIAILTSERAAIKDPKVKNFTERIIEAQRKDIEEMKILIKSLESEQNDKE